MTPGYPTQIEVVILNRKFPIKVNSLDEEASLRGSAIWLEQTLQHYKKRFFVRDEAYLVLMCFLEFAMEQNQNQRLKSNFIQDWESIEKLIDNALSKSIS